MNTSNGKKKMIRDMHLTLNEKYSTESYESVGKSLFVPFKCCVKEEDTRKKISIIYTGNLQ